MKCLKFQRVEMQDGNLRNLSCIHQTEAVARTKLWLQEGPDRFLSTGQVLNVATKEHIRKDTITFLIAFCIPEALQMNTGLYAEKMSFHHTAIKRSHDSQLHSRTKSFIHKNSCEFSSRELNAKGCGWVFVAGLGLLQQQNPDAKVPLLGSQMGHANLQKRRSASSWLLQRSKIFCFLKAVWILLPTAEVQHGKGNVSIQTSKKPILKKKLPQGEILRIHLQMFVLQWQWLGHNQSNPKTWWGEEGDTSPPIKTDDIGAMWLGTVSPQSFLCACTLLFQTQTAAEIWRKWAIPAVHSLPNPKHCWGGCSNHLQPGSSSQGGKSL